MRGKLESISEREQLALSH